LSPQIAILVDAENISHRYLDRILEEARLHGQIVLRAVYGDWQSPALQKWHEIAEKNDFKIRHQTNSSKTKNSADMKLIMDAMEVLFRTSVEVFCLVSNDADYVPLCNKIHESGKQVIGFGYQHASEAFIRACDKFMFLGRGEPPIESLTPLSTKVPSVLPKQPATPKLTNPLSLQQLLSNAFAKTPQDANRWVSLTALGSTLSQVGFKSNSYGHATLSKLLQSMPNFVDLQTNGTVKSARLKK